MASRAAAPGGLPSGRGRPHTGPRVKRRAREAGWTRRPACRAGLRPVPAGSMTTCGTARGRA